MVRIESYEKQPPLLKEVTVTLHYHRYDHDYEGWNLWVWLEGETGHMVEFSEEDSYGKTAVFALQSTEEIKRVGFIIRKSTEENDWAGKRFDDRFITSFDPSGHAEVWLMQGMERIYENLNDVTVFPGIISAKIDKWDEISVLTNLSFDWEHDNLHVALHGAEIKKVRVEKDNAGSDLANRLVIKTKNRLSLTKQYQVNLSHFGYCDVTFGDIMRTKKFDQTFKYDGFLGSQYSPEQTSFCFWAPSARQAEIKLFKNGEVFLFKMNHGECGTWHIDLAGDWEGAHYLYRVRIGKEWRETQDPYAKAVSVNGTRSAVVDLGKTNPASWKPVTRTLESPVDAVIYELHIRDATIHEDSGVFNKGKYLGLAEQGTVTAHGFSTGLDYLAELGVTHVQLLPFYDYWTVDETKLDQPQYNWGYDPKHFNAPEGSYSTDPTHHALRIKELKTLIQAIHDRGMSVIMDVVYNHVYDVARSPFHQLVPGYYFRYTRNGKLSNGTGVGNDTASERAMMRRFIVDSLVYWATEYQIDGFRFDLMGIHDVETMRAARSALDNIDPAIMMLGEGWDLQTALPDHLKANQYQADQMKGVAHFNDALRDHLKGNTFSKQDNGFINGRIGMRYHLLQGVSAGMKVPYDRKTFISPEQVVNYAEAHDNHTLWDKLCFTTPNANMSDHKRMHRLATSIILLSQGVPFLHAGQEFMRTKYGVENSYRSPDEINKLDWHRREEFNQTVNFIKGLIRLRKAHPAFRMRTKDDIVNQMHFHATDERLIAYDLTPAEGRYERYTVIHNAHGGPVKYHLDSAGPWHILADGIHADSEPLGVLRSDVVEVSRHSTYVLALPFNSMDSRE
ncbi:type I pullulanase [Jeotgalibacillus haloalkalitolerans]|uniref:pullulanase n=1 Tax=Jeotgalibacillus haloalkalitolerans TaxID=3104292 RepID=A0ABU5KPM3_9BACL|nr:type I pullulanase [Jeotgalibacillus sp. HH7-29]MDZ5713196.1 type I pullulanase [Jeotgalibacillus sp. HH7-29]